MQSLGTVTFTFNPDRQTLPFIKKTLAAVNTYSNVAVFQWPAIWPGTVLTLEWDFLPAAQFVSLLALYQSHASVVYSTDTGGHEYTVIVSDLVGEYFEVVATGLTYRRNVKLSLIVQSYAYNPPAPAPP